MSPEQARGEPITAVSDVFSLGATLLFAVTGAGPYGTGDPGLLMVRAASGKVERVPRSLPAPLRRLLQFMLDPRPDHRPSAASLAGGPEGTAVRSVGWLQSRRGALRRRGPWLLAGGGATALIVAGVVLAGLDDDDPAANPQPACEDRPYQPCGQAEPAPFTDGAVCVEDHADYDGDAANGCEAAPDTVDGQPLEDTLEANVVPADDVDQYPVRVRDEFHLLCDGTLVLTLVAPDGISLQLEIRDGDDVVGRTTSANRVPGVVTLHEANCLTDDGTDLAAIVTPIGSDRVAGPYVLRRQGNF
jgi:hypothetical protein